MDAFYCASPINGSTPCKAETPMQVPHYRVPYPARAMCFSMCWHYKWHPGAQAGNLTHMPVNIASRAKKVCMPHYRVLCRAQTMCGFNPRWALQIACWARQSNLLPPGIIHAAPASVAACTANVFNAHSAFHGNAPSKRPYFNTHPAL